MARMFFLLLAGLLCACGGQVKPPRDAADEFCKLVSAQKFPEAYGRASVAFKLSRSAQYFEARARELGLSDVTAVEWGQLEQRGRLTKMRGVFTKTDGNKLPLNFTFVLEGGDWRLHEAMSDPAPSTGVVDDVFAVAARSRDSAKTRVSEFLEPSSLVVPPEAEMRQLIEDTLMQFNEAMLNGGDFASLFAEASDRWKYRGRDPGELSYSGTDPLRAKQADPFNHENRLTTAALRNAFEAAIRAKVDLSPIKSAKMELREAPRINSDGVLLVNGSFDCPIFLANEPEKPNKLQFMFEYVMESSKWKLFGITVNILRVEKQPAQ